MTGRHRRQSWWQDWWHVTVRATADFWVAGIVLWFGAIRPAPPPEPRNR